MAPELRIYVPPENLDGFVAGLPKQHNGEVILIDNTVARDYEKEIDSAYTAFSSRVQGLLTPHSDMDVEEKRIDGYRSLIPELSDRTVFKAGDVQRIPTDTLLELREALVARFLSGFKPLPTRVINGDVAVAIGTPPVEMIMLEFGLEDGIMRSHMEIAKSMGVDSTKVVRDVKAYFAGIKKELNLPRRQATPLREVAFKIRRHLDIQRVK